MSAYAPSAIEDSLFGAVKQGVPAAVFSGVVGDVRHSFGYHLARADLPGDDYSVVLPLDKQGDPHAASALDVSLSTELMIAVTSRLVAAAKAKDPRLKALREFCGTTNGETPHPFDLSTGRDDPNNNAGWDDSHLSHIHLSFYRAYANDPTALLPIAAVMAGELTAPTEDDMAVTFHQYDKDPTPGRNKAAVYLVTVADGIGVSQQWLKSRAELTDRQARAKAAGNKSTTVLHPTHTRDYYGPVIGPDPDKVTP